MPRSAAPRPAFKVEQCLTPACMRYRQPGDSYCGKCLATHYPIDPLVSLAVNKWTLPCLPQVYFVRYGEHEDRPIKIGTSENVDARVRELQVSCPETLHLLATTPGNLATESRFHRAFSDHHIRGEWFRPNTELSFLIALAVEGQHDKISHFLRSVD